MSFSYKIYDTPSIRVCKVGMAFRFQFDQRNVCNMPPKYMFGNFIQRESNDIFLVAYNTRIASQIEDIKTHARLKKPG